MGRCHFSLWRLRLCLWCSSGLPGVSGWIHPTASENNFHPSSEPLHRSGKIIPLFHSLFQNRRQKEALCKQQRKLQERPGPDMPPTTGSQTPDSPFLPAAPAMASAPSGQGVSLQKVRDFSKITQLERITVIQTPGL